MRTPLAGLQSALTRDNKVCDGASRAGRDLARACIFSAALRGGRARAQLQNVRDITRYARTLKEQTPHAADFCGSSKL